MFSITQFASKFDKYLKHLIKKETWKVKKFETNCTDIPEGVLNKSVLGCVVDMLTRYQLLYLTEDIGYWTMLPDCSSPFCINIAGYKLAVENGIKFKPTDRNLIAYTDFFEYIKGFPPLGEELIIKLLAIHPFHVYRRSGKWYSPPLYSPEDITRIIKLVDQSINMLKSFAELKQIDYGWAGTTEKAWEMSITSGDLDFIIGNNIIDMKCSVRGFDKVYSTEFMSLILYSLFIEGVEEPDKIYLMNPIRGEIYYNDIKTLGGKEYLIDKIENIVNEYYDYDE